MATESWHLGLSWGSWAAEKKKGWQKQDTAKWSEDAPSEKEGLPPSTKNSPPKLSRWGSMASLGSGSGGVKEVKGADGIGRLDA